MKKMSKAAKLSCQYTNHCTRATVSKTLGDAEFDRSDIIKVTGHRDTRSLDTYIGEASSSKKRAFSDAVNNLICIERINNQDQCSNKQLTLSTQSHLKKLF